jgi:autoinducer 2 (AI-2) kinase
MNTCPPEEATMQTPLILVLDVGTTMLKASLISPAGDFAAGRARAWSYRREPDIEGGLTFDPDLLLRHFAVMIQEMLSDDPTLRQRIAAVTVSAQRLGFVLLDTANGPICGIPNIDRRAAEEAAAFQNDFFEPYYPQAGRWPGPQHLVTRLRWWRKHAPEQLRSFGKILSISDWIVYSLCGVMASEPTTACESCLLDVRTLSWNTDLLAYEAIPRRYFCDLVPPGSVAGTARGAASAGLGIPDGTAVVMGAGDTQLGVLGAGGVTAGHCAVVAGSSAPVNRVIDRPVADSGFRTVTNPHVVSGLWALEANAMLTGVCLTWVKELLFGDDPDGYAAMEAQAREYLAKTDSLSGLTTLAGASTANTRQGNLYPYGAVRFPMSDLNAGLLSRKALAFSAFESTAYAVLSNIEMLSEICGSNPGTLSFGGGEVRRPLWIEWIRLMTDVPIDTIISGDMSSLGAAMLAFQALHAFPDWEHTVRAMVRRQPLSDPVWLRTRPFVKTLPGRKKAWADALRRQRSLPANNESGD